jgi:stringent starvation protein B
MNTTKPYLVRAIYEWCVDNQYTPYVAVNVNSNTQVPMEYVENGEIILNISQNATDDLVMNNDYIQFMARFDGAPRKMQIPMDAVKGIFAKEINQGLTFSIDPEPGPGPGPENKQSTDQPMLEQKKQKKTSSKKPHLQVVK